MDIFSLGPTPQVINSNLQNIYNSYLLGLPYNHILKAQGVVLIKNIRPGERVSGDKIPDIHTIEFPIVNNEWTIGIFDFFKFIADDYHIANTYMLLPPRIDKDTFSFDVTDPKNRCPFVIFKQSY